MMNKKITLYKTNEKFWIQWVLGCIFIFLGLCNIKYFWDFNNSAQFLPYIITIGGLLLIVYGVYKLVSSFDYIYEYEVIVKNKKGVKT